MPSGKTHDAITFLLAVPIGAAAYAVTRDFAISASAAVAFLFGGLMFGPDLDTVSKQFSRWSFLQVLWYPYRIFFKHRSRWSHGLIFGTLIRVVYFMGVVTIAAFVGAYVYAALTNGVLPDVFALARSWRTISGYSDAYVGTRVLAAIFFGLWAGAASHTFTDMAGSYIKTGRVTEFL
ncbi:MAG TPA: metal-binding protein [Pyrinomonadaceae bacterium]|jgi:uncharacterized metal-binding protein|nr:metal-binding protein [Pyrinomonadaceae bacterium]